MEDLAPVEPADLAADLRRRLPCLPSATARAAGAGVRAAIALATFAAQHLPLYADFDTGIAAMQFVERASWIPAFNIRYHLGADGISVALIILTAFFTVLVLLGAWESIEDRVHQYVAAS